MMDEFPGTFYPRESWSAGDQAARAAEAEAQGWWRPGVASEHHGWHQGLASAPEPELHQSLISAPEPHRRSHPGPSGEPEGQRWQAVQPAPASEAGAPAPWFPDAVQAPLQRRRSAPSAQAEEATIGRPGWLYLLIGLAAVAILYVKTVGIDHQYFQLSNESSVETWALPLPMRYRLEYWRYLPASSTSGFRLFHDGAATAAR